MARNMVKRARGYVEDIEFSPMDASRSDPQYIYQMLEAVIDVGATTLNIPDTVGYSIPDEFGRLIAGIFKNVPNINKAKISVHCHTIWVWLWPIHWLLFKMVPGRWNVLLTVSVREPATLPWKKLS